MKKPLLLMGGLLFGILLVWNARATTTHLTNSLPSLTASSVQTEGFEFNHWPFPSDQAGQLAVLNTLGQQGWLECFTRAGENEIYCSRPYQWSTLMEWKSWEIPKRTADILPMLNEAGPNNYDQCFEWQGKRLWCSRPPNQ